MEDEVSNYLLTILQLLTYNLVKNIYAPRFTSFDTFTKNKVMILRHCDCWKK